MKQLKPQQTKKDFGILKAALDYAARGYSVIPVGRDKKPLISEWKPYQERRATAEEIRAWFSRFPAASIAIITGQISGIVVIDVEEGGKTTNLPATVMSRTGGGGYHFYYKHPGSPVKNKVRLRDKTDIRGDGGYAVAPPSLHKSGRRYEWAVSPEQSGFAGLPPWVLNMVIQGGGTGIDWDYFLAAKNHEGTRNMKAAQYAGKLVADLKPEEWEAVGWLRFRDWNAAKNKPPLEEAELRTVWESIRKVEAEKRQNKPGGAGTGSATKLVSLVQQIPGLVLFHDDRNAPFARIPIGGHTEIRPCGSEEFTQWLSQLYFEKYESVPSTKAISSAVTTISGLARLKGEEHQLNNRVAWLDGAIWYDLSDKAWRAVRITAGGWNVVDDPPILFRRFSHQRAQVEPCQKGDAREILKFIKVTNPDHQLLILAYLVACFVPDIAHPVLNLCGAQGSAKTFVTKILRSLADPSVLEVVGVLHSRNELAQVLYHHWFIGLDNLSSLRQWMSDVLCRAVSGDAFSKRQLFTDDGDVIFAFQRCICLNGVNLVARSPDLLDRSIIIELERIPEELKRGDSEMRPEFQQALPRILGGVFDALVKAVQIKPNVKLTRKPRMADFAEWGYAIAEALGSSGEEFMAAYRRNIDNQHRVVVGESVLAHVLLSLLEKSGNQYGGTPSALLTTLANEADALGIELKGERGWPKQSSQLTRQLNQLKTNLAEAGVTITSGWQGHNRWLSISYTPKTSVGSVGDEEGGDQGEAPTDDADGAPTPTPQPSSVDVPLRNDPQDATNAADDIDWDTRDSTSSPPADCHAKTPPRCGAYDDDDDDISWENPPRRKSHANKGK